MKKNIPYLKWRDEIKRSTPENCKIGNDILLIKDKSESDFIFGPFRLDMTIAIYIKKGCCRFMSDMKEYTAKSPCMIIGIPGQIFQICGICKEIESNTIIMSESFFNNLFKGFGVFGLLHKSITGNPVINLENDYNVMNAYFEMLENLMQSPLNSFKLEAARHLTLSMFYGYTYRLHGISEVKHATRQEIIFRNFENELKFNYTRQRNVSFYASKLCITPKYLSYIIKEQTGKTALEYIEGYTITECKALLLSTDMSIQEISNSLDFPSQSVFGKFFKRITGLSPKEYRNKGL